MDWIGVGWGCDRDAIVDSKELDRDGIGVKRDGIGMGLR